MFLRYLLARLGYNYILQKLDELQKISPPAQTPPSSQPSDGKKSN
jgi:hypothetical protein